MFRSEEKKEKRFEELKKIKKIADLIDECSTLVNDNIKRLDATYGKESEDGKNSVPAAPK